MENVAAGDEPGFECEWEEFGICQSHVSDIVKRRRWAHL